MFFWKHRVYLLRQPGWSQSELAKRIEVSREIVGRYERNDAVPSIDIAKRMSDAFEISLDYLVGKSEEKIDKTTLDRLLEINKLQPKDKEMVFSFLDAFLTRAKLQAIM